MSFAGLCRKLKWEWEWAVRSAVPRPWVSPLDVRATVQPSQEPLQPPVMPQDLGSHSRDPQPFVVVPYLVCVVVSYRVGGAEPYSFWNYTEGLHQRRRQWTLDEVYERRDDDRGLLRRIWEIMLWNREWHTFLSILVFQGRVAETRYVAHSSLDLNLQPKMTLNSWSSCIHFLGTWVTGMSFHV